MDSGDDETGDQRSIVSYYAAGIGVMFLLFSMAGAAASLLEEEESGTLERLLSSDVGMGTGLDATRRSPSFHGVAAVLGNGLAR